MSMFFGSGRYDRYSPRACRFIRSYVFGVADADAPPPSGMFPPWVKVDQKDSVSAQYMRLLQEARAPQLQRSRRLPRQISLRCLWCGEPLRLENSAFHARKLSRKRSSKLHCTVPLLNVHRATSGQLARGSEARWTSLTRLQMMPKINLAIFFSAEGAADQHRDGRPEAGREEQSEQQQNTLLGRYWPFPMARFFMAHVARVGLTSSQRMPSSSAIAKFGTA